MPYRNVLIPIDGSADALFACRTAAKLACAAAETLSIHLVYCVEPIAALVGGEDRENLHKDQEAVAQRIFTEACHIFDEQKITCQTHLRVGSPQAEIPAAAEELKCDIIVMGTRGHSPLAGLFLGSVSQSVLRNVKIPVLLANRPKN